MREGGGMSLKLEILQINCDVFVFLDLQIRGGREAQRLLIPYSENDTLGKRFDYTTRISSVNQYSFLISPCLISRINDTSNKVSPQGTPSIKPCRVLSNKIALVFCFNNPQGKLINLLEYSCLGVDFLVIRKKRILQMRTDFVFLLRGNPNLIANYSIQESKEVREADW